MKKLKLGVLGPSEIAFRRFLPALQDSSLFDFVGVAIASQEEWGIENADYEVIVIKEMEKAQRFIDIYGGDIFIGYNKLIETKDLDAIYIPLPPALHYKWGKIALNNNKHVFMEKPFTINLSETIDLIKTSQEKRLVIHENYMFVYHKQIEFIMKQLENKNLGDIRLINIHFGFPFRGVNDFRYDRSLGGGALLDCGGYTLKLASLLLGNDVLIKEATLNYKSGFDVDIYGSASMQNKDGLKAYVSFGMDNSYRCTLDIWGSKGSLLANRIFTAPKDIEPLILLNILDNIKEIKIERHDSFLESINVFYRLIKDENKRVVENQEILLQGKLVQKFIDIAGEKENGS